MNAKSHSCLAISIFDCVALISPPHNSHVPPTQSIFSTHPLPIQSRISGQQSHKSKNAIFYSTMPSPPLYFLLNEHPSVNLAFPPVGWHSTVLQPPQMTTVWACEKTVVMVKQPGHLTSMKKERGAGTRVWFRGWALVWVKSRIRRGVGLE